MPKTPAQQKAADKYIKEKVDELKIRVPKGSRAFYQEHAATKGESLNAFVTRAMKETIERDKR